MDNKKQIIEALDRMIEVPPGASGWSTGFVDGCKYAKAQIKKHSSDDKRKVGEMSVEISADTKEFEDKLTNAKELADQLLESLSKIPDVKVEVKGDINGNKSS